MKPFNTEVPLFQEILEKWPFTEDSRDQASKAQVFKEFLLNKLSLIQKEEDKISFLLKSNEIIQKILQDESFSQEKQNTKKIILKDMQFKEILFAVVVEIQKYLLIQNNIHKLVRELEAEFGALLMKIRKEHRNWEFNIYEQARLNEMEAELFLLKLSGTIHGTRSETTAGKIIDIFANLNMEFMKESGMDLKQMQEYHAITQKTTQHFANAVERFEETLTNFNSTFDAKKFESVKEIDEAIDAVDKEMLFVRKNLFAMLKAKFEMHNSAKNYIKNNVPLNKNGDDNIALYEKRVQEPGNIKFNSLLRNKLGLGEALKKIESMELNRRRTGARQSKTMGNSEQVSDASKTNEASLEQEEHIEPSAISKTNMRNIEKEYQHGFVTETQDPAIQNPNSTHLHAPVQHRTFKASPENKTAQEMFAIEMKHLEEKLNELARNKKVSLREKRAAILHNRSHLTTEDSIQGLKAKAEQLVVQNKQSPVVESSRAKRARMTQNVRSRVQHGIAPATPPMPEPAKVEPTPPTPSTKAESSPPAAVERPDNTNTSEAPENIGLRARRVAMMAAKRPQQQARDTVDPTHTPAKPMLVSFADNRSRPHLQNPEPKTVPEGTLTKNTNVQSQPDADQKAASELPKPPEAKKAILFGFLKPKNTSNDTSPTPKKGPGPKRL